MKSTRADWLVPSGLITLSLVPALAGTIRLMQLASGAAVTPENARFFAMPLPVMLHVPSVIVYCMLGALQFSPGFRHTHRAWHRASGRILIPCGLLAALSGLWMTQFYSWPAGDGVILYAERLVVGSAMVLAIVLGIRAIVRRDFAAHGEWMMRAYALGIGAGTQALTHLPWFILVGPKPGELPRAVMMGAGWAINIVVAEWIIRRAPARYIPWPASEDIPRIITTDRARLLEGIDVAYDDRFPTAEIVEVTARFPLFDRESENGAYWSSRVQEYLTLSAGGTREQILVPGGA
jgi:uncharacterized membrane protein